MAQISRRILALGAAPLALGGLCRGGTDPFGVYSDHPDRSAAGREVPPAIAE